MAIFRQASKTGLANVEVIDQLIFQASMQTRASAQMAAVVLTELPEKDFSQYVSSIYQIMLGPQSEKADDIVKAVLCLGEIGTFRDLSGLPNIITSIETLIRSEIEQIRQAAAVCLGGFSIGNTQFFL
jgi:hypothetical protein